MKSKLVSSFLFLQFFCACSSDEKRTPTSESDVDAARNFIRASLDNNFEEAQKYMLADSVNNETLSLAKRSRSGLSKEDNFKYKESSIRIYDTRKLNDSVSIISYANSFKNQKDSLKVVRVNGQWLVDFKYSFPAGIPK